MYRVAGWLWIGVDCQNWRLPRSCPENPIMSGCQKSAVRMHHRPRESRMWRECIALFHRCDCFHQPPSQYLLQQSGKSSLSWSTFKTESPTFFAHLPQPTCTHLLSSFGTQHRIIFSIPRLTSSTVHNALTISASTFHLRLHPK